MKTVPIEFKQVHDSYVKVRRGGKATGVDAETVVEFEKNIESNLYVIYNRLSSGSYHPPAIRAVEIPKKDGRTRKLGIPTLRDKIAQQVVKDHMEKKIEPLFHKSSYGYRPLHSAKEAVNKVKENSRKYDWVIDIDIKGFFDEIDHELMLKSVGHVMNEKWVVTYVERWLKAPLEDGTGQQQRTKGTPQGGVISPLLANLFLHFVFDKWMGIYYPNVEFVRYADDIIVHCKSQQESETMLKSIKARLSEVKLSVNESKTKIVYCKDNWRKKKHKENQFGFLGFSFQPRKTAGRISSTPFLSFTPAISLENQTKIKRIIKENFKRSSQCEELITIAKRLNPKIKGWINYYGGHYNRPLIRALNLIDTCLFKWLMIKHKTSYRKALGMLKNFRAKHPFMFAHWNTPFGPLSYQTARAV